MDKKVIREKMKKSLAAESHLINPSNLDGVIMKRIREERGISLKEAAGNIMSTRTLRRFEEDETSISVNLFHNLIKNLRIHYLDYILAVYTIPIPATKPEHNGIKGGSTAQLNVDLMDQAIKYMREGNYSAMLSTFVKDLKNEDITMMRRYIIASFTGKYAKHLVIPDIVKENSLIVFEYLQGMNRLSVSEKSVLNSIIDICDKGDIPLQFIRKTIEENKDFFVTADYFVAKMMLDSLGAIYSCCSFLARCGYVEEAEKHCAEAIERMKMNGGYNDAIHKIILNFNILLAQLKLRLNKLEGVELANKCIRQLDSMIDLSGFAELKKLREESVQFFYSSNKTKLDFDF